MAQSKKRRRLFPGMTVSAAVLANIVLILVLFFIVVEKIAGDTGDAKVHMPAAVLSRAYNRIQPQSVIINMHSDGSFFSGRRDMSFSEIKLMLADIFKNSGADTPLILRIDSDAKLGQFDKLIEAVRAAGLNRIELSAETVENIQSN